MPSFNYQEDNSKNTKSDDKKLTIITYLLIVGCLLLIPILYLLVEQRISAGDSDNKSYSEQRVVQDIQEKEASMALPSITKPLVGMAVGKYEGEKVHPLVDILKDLSGFKYDESVAPVDTVYIVYDPRCPYCHQLFDILKQTDLKAKEITVKWIPTMALGSSDEALKLSKLGMEAKNVDEFEKSFNKEADLSNVSYDQDTIDTLHKNMAFLYSASESAFGGDYPVSVPAVFFIDKSSGSPNMMYGAVDKEVFRQIFGD